MQKLLRNKKGQVAGMDMWIAVIVSVFLAGFLVMLFSLSSSEMQETVDDGTARGNTTVQILNDTTEAVSGATDWFDLIITIGAIIVIMMLVTVFIIAIRRTGLLGGGVGGA